MKSKLLRFVTRLAAGVFLIALSALASFLIKETLDSRDPDSSLPILTVSCGYSNTLTSGGSATTETYLKRAGYEWNFLTKIVKSATLPPTEFPLYPVTVMANTPIVINFSIPYETLKVSRSSGQYDPNFVPLAGELYTPSEPGDYCYCIEAGFDRGSIIYYFTLRISE